MRAALACCLALLLAPAAPAASRFSWTDGVQADYERLLGDVRSQRWADSASVSAGAELSEAEVKLATFSAALLSRLPEQADSRAAAQRLQQLRQHIVQVNLGRIELDKLLSAPHSSEEAKDAIQAAFRKYITMQKSMATSLGMDSAQRLWWSAFTDRPSDLRPQLETMWSETGPLVARLVAHLRSRPAPAELSVDRLVLECAAQENCSRLTQMALPYPDVANTVSDLVREKHLTSEKLAHLADGLMKLLGLPAATSDLWSKSQFGAAGECRNYVDAEKIRLCADGDLDGLRSALALMTDSEYWRAAATQPAPFQAPAFPGFERALSDCVELLALQPSAAQQLVYGYSSGAAQPASVSLYLARGARPAARPDPVCAGDVACQEAANGLMEAAVTKLLPLGYHMAALRWLESELAAPAADAGAAWRRQLQATLGVAAGAPADVDARFYDASGHVGRLLAGFAAFQLRAAACPSGGAACVTQHGGDAGQLLRNVMMQGSSQPWDELLAAVTKRPTPSASALVDFFQPLDKLLAQEAPRPRKVLHTMELEEDTADRRRHHYSASPAQKVWPRADAGVYCRNIINKTDAENVTCDWNRVFPGEVKKMTTAEWELGLNISDDKANEWVEARAAFLEARNQSRSELAMYDVSNWTSDSPTDAEKGLLGQMFILTEQDAGAAEPEALHELLNSTARLFMKYSSLSVCPFDNKTCEDGKWSLWDLREMMRSGPMEEQQLDYYWSAFRNAAKDEMADAFTDYVSEGNDAAKAAGLDHYGQLWLQPYGYGGDNDTLLQELADTWAPLQSLYELLHSYVRFRLHDSYSSSATGKQPLPSHLLGDLFAENWINIYNYTVPYDNYSIDITNTLVEKHFDAVKMRDNANTFLKGMGLQDLVANKNFKDKSEWLSCEVGRDCEALAWSARDGSDDVRVRMTNNVNMDNFELAHLKMAEVEYFLQYKDLDPEFRAPANPAFLEAVAGAISLSVLNPKHLKDLKLIDEDPDDMYYIDYLYRRALQYLVPMPFDYVTQTWRWMVFNGSLNSGNWERRWWEMREDIQGVRPANRRHDSDADPLSVPAVARDRPAFQRYMATLLQFQLFEFFCIKADQYDPADDTSMLHECDLSNHPLTELSDLMGLGNSERWRNVVEQYTENHTLSADAMLKYFEPLNNYLQDFVKQNNLQTGWVSDLDDYYGDEATDNTVPIVVGVVLGVLVLIVLIAYFVVHVRQNKAE